MAVKRMLGETGVRVKGASFDEGDRGDVLLVQL
jgi:hypothetical protein